MSIRKFADLANETDSKFNNLKDTKRRAKISDRFDDTTHNEQPSDEALQYLNIIRKKHYTVQISTRLSH